jgi:hypothetical protein
MVAAQIFQGSPLLTVPADVLAFIFTNGTVHWRALGFGKLRSASLANEIGHKVSFGLAKLLILLERSGE